jgi:WD40 repeat protein
VPMLAFTPDGSRLVTASLDRTARLWEAATGRELAVLHAHREPVTCVDVSPDGTTLATSDMRGELRLWDLATYQELFTIATELRRTNDVSFSPDGRRLAVAGEDPEGGGHVQVFSATE